MSFTHSTHTIVIGGTSGIGAAVVRHLRQRPGRVEFAGRSTGLDVSNPASVARYFDMVGEIDHVVFTAGSAAPGGAVTDVALREAKAAFDTKFWGSVVVAKAAARHLRPDGTITLTSGFLARRTVPGAWVKTAMNAAIEATAKMLARELAPIRVNVVSPGLTDTEAYAGMDSATRQAMFERTAASLPAGKVGSTDDLAAAYLFAIDNSFVTGAVIDIDGGALVN